MVTLDWSTGSLRTVYEEPPDRLDEILHRLRLLTAEPVGALGKFVVDKKGSLWIAEEP